MSSYKSVGWDDLVERWLHSRPKSTQGTYGPVIADFRVFIRNKPISRVAVEDIQKYADSYSGQKPRTIERKLRTITSIFSYAYKAGYIRHNPAVMLRFPKFTKNIAEKILPQKDIIRMIKMEPDPRNSVLIRVLYATGIRASEASGLKWKDCRPRDGGAGQITVTGKGNKTRTILLSEKTWKALQSIRPAGIPKNLAVFPSKRDSTIGMDRTRITHVVREAAERACIDLAVSAHWMRHGHASHALDKGVSIAVIQRTLGHESIETTTQYLHIRPNQSSAVSLGV